MNKDISEQLTNNNDHILHNLADSRNKISKHIGNKIRERRIELGYSQLAIAKRIDIPLQKIQKYESGAASISANQLFIIANIIGVKMSFFFHEFEHSSGLQELRYAADDIVNHKLRDAIMGIIDIVIKKPDKS